ncbi:MAG TPA: NADH-quinone oxidoreductase subunit NuoE [Candidatus Dormibacteraeota bacterium]|nr:NADH-quinone oxidoreductase subunit NuoE [Candidatus Dormibacteraeota bacterium]
MLTPEEQQEIEAEAVHFPVRRAACIDALRVVQKHRGWVSDEAVRDIAEFLHTSADDVDTVATFYNLIFRQPVGRHVIMICDSVSCWLTGYDQMRDHLKSRLGIEMGQTTPDSRFTLLPVVCLGACDRAPVMIIDGQLHKDLNSQKIDEILEGYK